MGRRKIEIKMVKDTNTRQVTFSKRRTGLFKKANELSILCGAEVAIVVFSPGNKPYSFGHPDVESVASRFLEQEPRPNVPSSSSSCDANMEKLNQQLNNVMNQLHEEEKKGEVYDKALNQRKKTKLEELQEMLDLAAELKFNVKSRLDDMEAVETMLMIKEKPIEFDENHDSKRKRRED
ncbi:PREDICTED: agamous-like MADS-box protein AGL29 [Lupinus angustifolius]|uniref:agamous-like MADS-box protein AGL29 n=1 Tax=Lupinus angustifolius TaxID=3871 RepID=UPI00092EE0DB|nr:PREDICTED: agamous-like MADS-box protein AGL29 [Lupinus angustifolius]